jgi:hypothetical protein
VEDELPQLLGPRHLELGLVLVGLRMVVPRLWLDAPEKRTPKSQAVFRHCYLCSYPPGIRVGLGL